MKFKKLLLTSLLALVAGSALAQDPANANFVFTTPGTTTVTTGGTFQPNESFSFSIRLNYPGTPPDNIESLSYWFQVPTAFAPFLTITTQSISDGSAGSPSLFNTNLLGAGDFPQMFDSSGDSGMLRNSDDLGGTVGGAPITPSASSYYISTLTFQLANAPQGTYTLQTTLSPPTSLSNDSGDFFRLPQATFDITVVPEPSTWALLSAGALGLMAVNRFRTRRKM